MDVEQLKADVREERISGDRLVEMFVASQRQLQVAQRRIAELEERLGGAGTVKVEQPFSVRAEEKRQEARGKLKRKRQKPVRRGRVTTAEKVRQAKRTEKCFPADVPESECWLSHTRTAWRLEEGRAVLVAYDIYRGPKNQ